jgi:hypothetical protein
MAYLVMAVFAAVGWGVGHMMCRRGLARATAALVVADLLVFGLILFQARGRDGWDALAHFLFGMMILAPVGAGLLLGALTAYWVGQRRKARPPDG